MTKPTWDPKDPLGRIPGESVKANKALNDYATMGPGRSLRKLNRHYKKLREENPDLETPTKNVVTINRWSTNHQWQARVEAAQELIIAEQRKEWAERELELRRQNWEDGTRLRQMMQEVMDGDMPALVRRSRRLIRGKEGEPDREIITLGMDVHGLARILELAIKAQESATRPAATGSEEHPINVRYNADQLSASVGAVVAETLAAAKDAAASWQQPEEEDEDSPGES